MHALLTWIGKHPVGAALLVLVAVVPVVILQLGGGSDQDLQLVLDWLTCEECVDGELQAVLDSVGDDATDVLAQFLLAPTDGPLANRSPELADPASNHRATIQQRAIRALLDLDDLATLGEAYAIRDSLEYRPDVIADLQDALASAGLAGPNFPAPASVFVTPDTVALLPQSQAHFGASVVSDSGRTMSYQAIVWSVDDGSVAQVDSQDFQRAVVSGVGPGSTVLRGEVAGVQGTGIVQVTDPAAAPPAEPGRIRISSGNAQTDTAGAPLPEMLTVQVLDSIGTELNGVPVTFRVTRGSAALGPPAAPVTEITLPTGVGGEARVPVRLGPVPGAVWIEASVSPADFRPSVVRFQLMALPPP